MKKIVRTLVSLIVAFAALCGITACSDDEKECEHEWNSGKVTVEATCTEEGEMTYTCSLCGETKTEDIDALGHDFSGELVNTDAQGHYHKCTRCGETDTVEAHVMVDGEIITPATTEHEGAQRIYCSVCGYESIKTLPVLIDHRASDDWETDDTYHWRECAEHEDCGVIFDKGEHEYLTELVDQYVPATCEHDGYSVWQCVCGKTEQHVIPKDESLHEWDEGVVTVEATCGHAGVMTYTCTVCGKTRTEDIPALEHIWDEGEVTTEATCGHAGVMTYTCTLCGETRTEDIPALEHIWDEGEVTTAATCGHAGVMTYTCTLCGETRTENIPALEHIFSDEWVNTDAEGHYHQCVSCGAIDEKIAHTLVLVQDEENNKHYWECSVCGYKGEPSDHEWGEGVITTPATLYSEGVRTYTCECGATKTEVIPAGASFAADFSIENQDGAWGYGAANITNWDGNNFGFEFTPATDKNADTWLINSIVIKSGWVNANGMTVIAYKVESDIVADISVSFVGINDGSRVSLRLAVFNADGKQCMPVEFIYDESSSTASRNFTLSLLGGSTVYVFANGEGAGDNAMGGLTVHLTPATVAADFGDDFSTENQDGAWSYGKVDYQWGNPEDFTFIAASEKTEDGEGWKAGIVEIRSNYITFDEMSAIGYTAESSVTLKAYVVLEGVTDATRADLRVGIKNAEGVIRENPSFHNNVNGSVLCVTVDITLNAGDTVYFIFSNGNGGTPEATPAGGLHISLVQTAA